MACLFCQIIAGDVPADRVFEDDRTVVIRDINPQAPVHVLVLPREHLDTVHAFDGGHSELLSALFATARRVAESLGVAEGGYRLVFNAGANGGQTVYHVHMHLLGGRFMTWPPG
ncbi:MAG: histidine triad nucleotide-binding protein [Candidatus Dormibacteria bacterium]